MSSTSAMLKRARRLKARLCPLPRPEVWLPTGVFLDENGDYLPGHQAIAERCARAGIIPNVYVGFNPDEDGCEA